MGRPAIADGVVDARGASRTQSVLARARDRCQGARRRAGHGRDRINARYRAADPRSTRQRQAQVIRKKSSSREAVQHTWSPPDHLGIGRKSRQSLPVLRLCVYRELRPYDYVTESPNVSGDDRSVLPLADPARLAVQVEEPT